MSCNADGFSEQPPRRLLCPIHGAAGNFLHMKTLLTAKLKLLQAAAPRATLHMLNDGGRFVLYLGQAAAARRLTELGSLTDCAADPLDESIPVLAVELEDMPRFIEEVTVGHTVALIDVSLPTKTHVARHVMFAYFPRKKAPSDCTGDLGNEWAYHDAVVAEEKRKARMKEAETPKDDFWG